MSASEKQLEKTLLEAGKTLFYPPRTSVKKILHLLDKVFICLSDVKQSPSSSIQNALSPVTNALVFERLFKHSNLDVNIAVASCITEVMRINAPNAPYDDEKMKEVFQLIVSSFEHLDDESSLSYTKRISILDCVAKCKVCSVMLDLQFDALLIEMFQHFLKALRDHHPVKVLRAMEDIMTLVLNESNDIPPELLSSILHYFKKDNEVPNITRRLAGQVLFNSASKFKTYLAEAVKSSRVSLDEYSNVVAMICKGDFDDLKQNEVMADKEDHAETEAQPHKRARVQSRSLHKPHGEVDKTVAEGEPSCRNHKRARIQRSSLHKPHGAVDKTASKGEPSCGNEKSSPELEDSQPCSITHQLAKVKQRIVDTLTSVRHFCNEIETKEQGIVDTLTSLRQFRSELETKEETLEASLHEVDVLGEKISRINKIINL